MTDLYLPAAKYWSQFLRDAQANSEAAAGMAIIDLLHTGGERITGAIASIFGKLLNDQAKTLTTEGIDRFEKALLEAIRQNPRREIGVDYNPCEELMNALQAGGMTEPSYGQYFPFNTWTRISEDGRFTVMKR